MGKRIYPLNRLKYWWAYDIDEICEVYKQYKLHPKTVRQWIKKGLPTMTNGNPALIYGNDLIKFLGKQNKSGKCQTEFDQMFCMKCQDAKSPLKKQIQLEHTNGFLKAKGCCLNCKSIMYKSYKLDDLQKLKLIFHTVDVLELYDSTDSTVNTPFLNQDETHKIEPAQMELFLHEREKPRPI